MNFTIIEEYIKQYKERFDEISIMEIYKWKAVKHFQDHWDIESKDFAEMLSESLSQTKNLLGSGQFFPRRMIRNFAKAESETVRSLFKLLFNPEIDLETRVQEFRSECDVLKNRYYKADDNHYQDDRAILVYLNLKFPQEFYLYKYRMFRDFSHLVNYPYTPKTGDFNNVLHFQTLCDSIKEELLKDNELINFHHKRLMDSTKLYQDPAYTLLTQDFIYACVTHFEKLQAIPQPGINVSVETAQIEDFTIKKSVTQLKGRFTNYEQQQKRNSITGITGERFVMEYERERLEELGVKNIPNKLKHTSVEEGDGLGYDIQSIDENGNEIYIEVKTTAGSFTTPFYITNNELYCSQQHPDKFRLYRLYNFDSKKKTGKIKIFSGDLSKLCIQAANFQVALIEKK